MPKENQVYLEEGEWFAVANPKVGMQYATVEFWNKGSSEGNHLLSKEDCDDLIRLIEQAKAHLPDKWP